MMKYQCRLGVVRPLYIWFSLAICGIAFGTSWVFAQPSANISLPHALQALIQHTYPDYALLTSEDVDLADCEKPTNHPGVVQGDFNGDGLADYAVVLIGRHVMTKEFTNSFDVGRTLAPVVDVKFVIYFGRTGSRFKQAYMESIDQNPGQQIIGISHIERGDVIKESPVIGDKVVTIRYQGVMKYHCGKWADVFYWDAKKKRIEAIRVVE